MAVYNEILVGRFNRALQKLFGMKGPPSTPQLSSEIIPVVDFPWGIENRYLEGWNRFAFMFQQGGVAGNLNAIRIRNPVGSNVIAVLEKLIFTNQAAALQTFSLSNGASTVNLATLQSGLVNLRLDPRGNPVSNMVISTENSAAPGTLTNFIFNAFQALSNANYDSFIANPDQELPLLPGDAYQMETGVANQGSVFSFVWRERPLEESERT